MIKVRALSAILSLSCLAEISAQEPPVIQPAAPAEEPAAEKKSAHHISEVTLYQGTALVTRRVTIPVEKAGAFEILVSGLPTATDPESVFADEGTGLEVRSVTCRMRSSEETKRVDSKVTQLDKQIKELTEAMSTARNEITLRRMRQEYLRNLGNFVAPAARLEMAHGVIQATELEKVTKMQFDEYETASQEFMKLDLGISENNEHLQGLRDERNKLTSGPTQIYDAVVFVEKEAGKEASFDLNYLVADCGWEPVYNVRVATGGKEVRIEFNALIHQVSGEDWKQAGLTLSTASPTVNAQNPELAPLHVQVLTSGLASAQELATQAIQQAERYKFAIKGKKDANRKVLSGKSVEDFAKANFTSNDLAASAQLVELSMRSSQLKKINQQRDEDSFMIDVGSVEIIKKHPSAKKKHPA
ncbi:mucoidy inhibitor MuiA family protein [Akkermansiaceae bacterium]|nr:mucoidy inhibitor MuiA family protein [bacterium]MDB4313769.1 mucoidy inhibitor MuiA family protein [Akkermansiaceae bacterium]